MLAHSVRRSEIEKDGDLYAGSSETNENLLTDYKSDYKTRCRDTKRCLFKCTKVKKRKRTKITDEKRNFACNSCEKSYYSHPALYTHNRNKHNIIPNTGKQQNLKSPSSELASVTVKFKCSARENDSDLLEDIIPLYGRILNEYFSTPQSCLYQEQFECRLHRGYQILNFLLDGDMQKEPKIDYVLIVYLIYFSKVARDMQVIEMIARFVILLREHINIVGWDYKKRFLKDVSFDYNGEYSSCNDCQEIPGYINDFISVFLEIEGINFNYEMKDIMDICQNFCNWLFVNHLTNFKITTM